MNTVKVLLDATEDIWSGYNEHPFVKGMEDGTLDREKFRYYLIQDYLYLEEYAKVFAIGVAKARSPETLSVFSKYLSAMNNELDIHNGYFATFGVTDEEIRSVRRSLDNLSYASYMLRVAYEEGEVEILTAVLSCAYSYEVISKRMIRNNPSSVDDELYGDWIKGYSSKDYSEENIALMEMLDRLTENISEERLEHLVDIFVACSRYEMMFWDMAWNRSI